ncbi:MAG: DUF5615 family PIN-like protein [Chloroflexi bacterium]|nr:DUF5615 family PIN-like protein [Chloroflexota bacterium]
MRLLFDQNLSPHLQETLRHLFLESIHVRTAGLEAADDVSIWEYARENEISIVTKDSDFRQLSFTHGPPPKVIWIRRANCSTSEIESLLSPHFPYQPCMACRNQQHRRPL